MNADEFYNHIQQKLENQQNSKTLAELVSNELRESNKLRNALQTEFNENPDSFEPIINKLKNPLLEAWQKYNYKFFNIFSPIIYMSEEANVVHALNLILNPKQKIMHTPELIQKLEEEYQIANEEIQPPIKQKIITSENRVRQFKEGFYNIERKYNLTPEIHLEIQKRLNEKNRHPNIPALQKPIRELKQQTSSDIINESKKNSKYVTRPDVPLNDYTIAMEISPEEFIEKNSFDLTLLLNWKFDSKKPTQDILSTKGETVFQGSALEDKLHIGITTHQKHTIIFFDGDREQKQNNPFAIFAAKMIMENYCKEKNINFYFENTLSHDAEIILENKITSAEFAIKNKKAIVEEISKDKWLRMYDMMNHTHGYNINHPEFEQEFDRETFLKGNIKYSKRGLYNPPRSLSRDITIPILQISNLFDFPENYEPKIGELEAINEIIQHAKDWVVFDIPAHLVKDYIKIAKTFSTYENMISEMINTNNQHVEPILFSEKEIIKNPELQNMDEDDTYFNLERQLILSKQRELKNIYNYFAERLPEDIKKTIAEKEKHNDKLGVLEEIYFFTENMLKTIEYQALKNPDSHYQNIINALK